mmetsp:Transcript_652/g.2658  ORF Transcript_652/g.2658 Transcript_652/m.2658 type:complete len:236 (+) Transcript_652:45-752(+)
MRGSVYLLLAHPGLDEHLVVQELVVAAEPQRDLPLRALHRVGSVDDVAANLDGEIPADGPGRGLERVGRADHQPRGLDDAGSLPDHAHDGAAADVVAEVSEEGLGGEVLVVFLGDFARGHECLEALADHALLLEPGDDLAHVAALDAVGLDHDVRALGLEPAGEDREVSARASPGGDGLVGPERHGVRHGAHGEAGGGVGLGGGRREGGGGGGALGLDGRARGGDDAGGGGGDGE